jgi:hypothetical protein
MRELQIRKGKASSLINHSESSKLPPENVAFSVTKIWPMLAVQIGAKCITLSEDIFGILSNWPMLSAIVMNKQNVRSGAMEPETLKGFVGAARDLGYPVTDEEAFLREQQARADCRAKVFWPTPVDIICGYNGDRDAHHEFA